MIDKKQVMIDLERYLCHVSMEELLKDVIALLKEQEAQHDYEASIEMTEYCERYEQTYNTEDGSM